MFEFRWPWKKWTYETRLVEAIYHLGKLSEPVPSRTDGSKVFVYLSQSDKMPITIHFTEGPVAKELAHQIVNDTPSTDEQLSGVEFQ